jgi:SAM-dependent methyltransferase
MRDAGERDLSGLDRFAALERSGWARRATTYDGGFGRLAAGAHRALLDAAMVQMGTHLLEVGCGTGQLANEATTRGAEVVASDAVEGMTALAGGAVPSLRVMCAALPDLPFRDAVFDAAVGAFVINHVLHPGDAVAELARVTRSGGAVALSCWDTDRRNRAQGVFRDALASAKASRPAAVPARSPFTPYATEDGLAALLRHAGLGNVRVDHVTWTHRVDPDQWWRDVLSGTVLTSAMIGGQPADTFRRVRTAYDGIVSQYLAADRFLRLPAAALVAVGEA